MQGVHPLQQDPEFVQQGTEWAGASGAEDPSDVAAGSLCSEREFSFRQKGT